MNQTLITILCLLAAFQVKHFLCDYPLQRPFMLRKGAGGRDWIRPLAAHALVHALGTLLIVAWYYDLMLNLAGVNKPLALPLLAALDFAVHFTVDRVKASPALGGRWTPAQPFFWWALGADQMAHHFTHYAIIFALINA